MSKMGSVRGATGLLLGKKGLVFGASSKYSLGLHVAKAWYKAGAADIRIACESDDLCAKIEAIASKDGWWDSKCCSTLTCDVNNDEDIDRATGVESDMILHAVAAAPVPAMRAASICAYTRKDFLRTMETSAYSLLAIAARAKFPATGGSIISLTFDSSTRVVPGYGAMAPAKAALETLSRYLSVDLGARNIRVNCISPGPLNTPAARVIPKFHKLVDETVQRSPLRRPIQPEDVASVACFLSSDMAAAITGETIHVDCGESISPYSSS